MSDGDPFSFETELPGGVLRRDDPRGSRPALVVVSPGGLLARTEDGEVHEVPWRGIRLREADGGDGIYCTAADRSLTIHSAHPDFLRALEAAGQNDLNDALSRLAGERVSSRLRHRVGCAAVIAVAALLAWTLPRLFRGAVSAAVDVVPYSVDESIGESVFAEMDAGGPEVDDPELRAAVQAMIDRLAPASAIPEAEFRFKIVENEMVNAFALPGGYIVVFTGLLAEAERPEIVAGVLAHEMSHVTMRHGLRRMAHMLGLWAGVGLVLGNYDTLTSIAVQLFTLSSVNDYSQDQETEADLEGVRMMIEVGIDPAGLVEFFERLEETHGDVPASLAWLSTHPRHRERIAAVQARERELGGGEYAPLEVDWDAVQERLGGE